MTWSGIHYFRYDQGRVYLGSTLVWEKIVENDSDETELDVINEFATHLRKALKFKPIDRTQLINTFNDGLCGFEWIAYKGAPHPTHHCTRKENHKGLHDCSCGKRR